MAAQRVQVYVRTRPTPNFASDSILIKNKMVTVSSSNHDWNFNIDGVLHNSSQEEVYATCAKNVVSRVMKGINGTVFAYGQTGAGKTYTMVGETQFRLRGIIPRAISQIFKEIREREDCSIIVRISCLEIYNETLTDLLVALPDFEITEKKNSTLTTNESKTECPVKGLTIKVAENEEEALNMFFEAERNRSIGEHSLNKQSSRSHVIFTIYVEIHSHTSANLEYVVSKLNLIDLAGSERLKNTESTGTLMKEAIYINKSLSFLEQVVIALGDKHRIHVPYRQSKLTQIIKDSIGGNCSTVMIANIWGETIHIDNTIATLRFAVRIMAVPASPQTNIHYNPMGLIQKYEKDIKALKEELAMQDLLSNKTTTKSTTALTETQIGDIKHEVKQFIAGNITDINFSSVREIREIFTQFKEYMNSIEKEYQEKLQTLQETLTRLETSSSDTATATTTATTVTTDDTKQPPVSQLQLPSVAKAKGKVGLKKSLATNANVVNDGEDDQVTYDKKIEEGISDGNSFSIGQATSAHKSSSNAKRKIISFMPKMAPESGAQKSKSKNTTGSVPSNGELDNVCVDEDKPSTRPSTPPSRLEAFEMFKKGRGKELKKIFLQNKELLQKKRKEAYDISCQLNQLTQKISKLRQMLSDRKESHFNTITTTDGKLIIDSEEYSILTKLQEVKEQYKTQFAMLQALHADIPYCEQYTQQSRQRLLQEFDIWYKIAFIGEKPLVAALESNISNTDQQERPPSSTANSYFKDLQQAVLQQGDPSTNAFYYAHLRTHKRGLGQRRPATLVQQHK